MAQKGLKETIDRILEAAHSAVGEVDPEEVVLALISSAATYAVLHGADDAEGFAETAAMLFDAAHDAFAVHQPVEVSRFVH